MPILIDSVAPSGQYPKVQFVDAPDLSANVRFDFNYGKFTDEDVWPGHDGFSLGFPTLEGDPDTPGAEYGPRRLSLPLFVRGAKVTAERVISSVSRELLRPDNWLFFQWSANSTPVWFRTFRTQPAELDPQLVLTTDDSSLNIWGLDVPLDAKPFAYGVRVDLPAVTITNDPSTGTNPCSYWLPSIIGDAPAPLVVQAGTVHAGQRGLLSVTSLPSQPTGYVAPFRIPDESWVTGTDAVGASIGSGGYTGASGGSTAITVSFATDATMVTRASGTSLAVYSAAAMRDLLPGSYRAFLRVGFDTVPSSFQIRLGQQNSGGSYAWNDTATAAVSSAANKQYIDLGTISHPFGNPVPEGSRYAGYTQAGPSLAIQASRPTGTGSLLMDDLILVPASLNDAETTMALVTMGSTISGATGAIYDGEMERVIMLTGATQFGTQSTATQVSGGFPTVTPGASNFLHYFPTMDADSLTSTTDLTLSYQPQWLYLGSS